MFVVAFFRYGTASKMFIRVARIRSLPTSARMRRKVSRTKRVRFSSEPPYLPGRVRAPRQFVEQVAVALLEVDEVAARVSRHLRRDHVGVLEAVELIVGEDRVVGRHRLPFLPEPRERVDDRVAHDDEGEGKANRPEWVSWRPIRKSSAFPQLLRCSSRAKAMSRWSSGKLSFENRSWPGVGAAFGDDGARLAPETFAPPRAKRPQRW
jgi:hypothetical protein